MVGENVGSTNNATFNMTSGKISSELTSASATDGSGRLIGVDVIGESTFNLSGGYIKSSESLAVYFGTIGNTGTGRFVANNGEGGGGTFTMTGGKLESNASQDLSTIQVSGNHVKTTTINISGGEVVYNRAVKDNDTDSRGAIFSAGVSNITISDNTTITSTHVGIEMRAGTLNVKGGTIESTSNEVIEYDSETNAAFRRGVGIAVAQSNTAKNITVNIESGTVTGYSALTIANPKSKGAFDSMASGVDTSGNHNGEPKTGTTGYRETDNDKYQIGTVEVNVTGGTLSSISEDDSELVDVTNSTKYKLKGKNAIANLDNRVTVNLSGTIVNGNIIATTREDSKNGYNVGEDNTFSNSTVLEESDKGALLSYATISGSTSGFSVSKLGFGNAFTKDTSDNVWRYIVPAEEEDGTATVVAAFSPKSGDSSTFELTVDGQPSLKTPADVDFTQFKDIDDVTKIDASAAPASFPLNITGNDKITSIAAGAGNDTLTPGDVNGITLTGGAGNDLFVFNGGSEKITDFGDGSNSLGTDFISMPSSFRPANADFAAEDGKISLDFGGDVLMFDELGDREVSLSGGHIFATRYHAIDKQSITFTTVQSGDYDASSTEYETIDAGLAGASIAITGNDKDNRIIGSNRGGTLNGGEGNDKIFVTERDTNAKYRFEHTAGKDVVDGFDDANDTLSVELTDTTEAKGSSSKLTLTFGKNDNIALKSDAGIEKVILPDNRYLTDSGYFGSNGFKLFQNAKGKIDFTDAPYKGTGIQTIDATNSKKKSVTLTADANVTTVKLADNKKKDQFDFAGGTVSITGYESGKDKLNIANVGAVSLFSVDTNGVSINAGGSNVISIQGAKDKEVMIRDGVKGNSYSKYVFHDTGILYNKAKRPTEAKIYSNVVATETSGEGEDATTVAKAITVDNSIKKVFLQEGVAGVSIQSSNNKTTLDASAAGVSLASGTTGVSLIGGSKNNRFVGSDYGDMFVYKGGKDAVTNFQVGGDVGDSISFDTGTYKIEDAKISLSKKSLKFKFSGKNALDLKSDGAVSSLSFGNQSYTFAKNAYSTQSGTASLTSAFSGSYNLSKSKDYSTVDGSRVKKNLTFKGTDGAEVLTGGTKKTNFKGGGGADSLVGGSGKDTFFYAKGDSGTSTIANFDFGTDKLKIANGTIQTITKAEDSISFEMSSGGKNGSFQLTSYSNNGTQTALAKDQTDKVAFKVNNTHYWFAQSDVKDGNTTLAKQGELITWDKKVTARDVAGLNVIDLGYSTNLAKTGLAVKVSSTATGATLPSSSGSNSN